MLRRWVETLSGRHGALTIAALALLLSLPALRLGFQADDHILSWHVEHGQSPWWLFAATDEMITRGRDEGAVAWWASPNVRVLFFRPASSALHWVEMSLWPNAAWAMLLLNLGVYVACCVSALHVYRRLLPTTAAALASLMFAIDDAHAHSIGWISGRNTLLALLGSLLALWCHLIERQDRRRIFSLWSTVAVALALGAAEAGTWSLGLLLAYAFTLESGSLRTRATSIAPQLAVGLVWMVIYVDGEFGLRGSSFYHSLREPIPVLANVASLPLAITSLLGPSVIALFILVRPYVAQLLTLPLALVLLWWVVPRIPRTPQTRFFVAAGALCVLPTFMTWPQDRILIGSGIGAFALIASVLDTTSDASDRGSVWTRRLLKTFHLGLAPLMFPLLLGAQHGLENGTQALISRVQPRHDVILLNTPVELLSNYVFATLDHEGQRQRQPNTLHQLYSGASALSVFRPDSHSIDVTADSGWGEVAVERIFCTEADMPKRADVRHARNITAQVLEVNARGMPKTVRFTFPTPLESLERQWLVWQGTQPVAWTPPTVGTRVRVAPTNLLSGLPQ